jgi:hypothetical protein
MLSRGKKSKQWDRTRAKLKKQFEAMNVVTCEMCGRSNFLSFAHRLKRRHILTDEELEMVALLCMDGPHGKGCHTKLEHGPQEEMYDKITELIERRKGH